MRKFICFFLIFSIALALPCYAKENDNIKADSWLYLFDIIIDNTMFKIGLKSAESIAKERLKEVNEAINLEDTEALTKAKKQLDKIMPDIDNDSLISDVFKIEQKIEENYEIDLSNLIINLNKYPNLAELTKGYDAVGISLIGLKTGYYAVYMTEGRILSIEHKQYLIVPNLELDYAEILKASQDQDYMNEKLDELLKYKKYIKMYKI